MCVLNACVVHRVGRKPPVTFLTFTARTAFSFHWLHGYPLTRALPFLHSKSGQRQERDAGLLFNHHAPSSQDPSCGIRVVHETAWLGLCVCACVFYFLDRECSNLQLCSLGSQQDHICLKQALNPSSDWDGINMRAALMHVFKTRWNTSVFLLQEKQQGILMNLLLKARDALKTCRSSCSIPPAFKFLF